MREIKYRQPTFVGMIFQGFHYWGDVNGGFCGPIGGNIRRDSQQYTGIPDKHGKKICEGDEITMGRDVFVAEYLEEGARFVLASYIDGLLWDIRGMSIEDSHLYEITGNIWEDR
jgi:hypothetical protein